MGRSYRIAVFTAMAVANSAPSAAEPKFVVGSDWAMIIPKECSALVPQPPETPLYWDRWMSLAACLQDNSTTRLDDPEALGATLKSFMAAAGPSMILYHHVLDTAPEVVQLRAAYHVGLEAVALITRARTSISASDARTEQELRTRLEPLLEPMKQMARTAFGAVIDGATNSPETASDPVNRRMVESSTILLRALARPHHAESYEIAHAPRR